MNTTSSSLPMQIQEFLHQRRCQEADRLIAELKINRPNEPETHYLEGVAHYFQNRIKEAIRCFKKALEINPNHTDSAICLAALLNDISMYDEAKGVFQKANQSISKKTGIDPDVDRKFSSKHSELGDLYFKYRRFDEALDEYKKAIALNANHLELRVKLAKSYAKKGFLSRAVQELQTLKRDQPGYTPARIQLGLLYYSVRNTVDAAMEWDSVLRIDPDHAEAKSYLEMLKRRQG